MSSCAVEENDQDDGGGRTEKVDEMDRTIRLRSYQTEMLEKSLKSNIIVVMDTGSGKTHIALARAAAELEVCETSQRVWMLCPSVALCQQQAQAFRQYLPAYNVQLLLGEDDIDKWSDESTWAHVLRNISIVVSTHQILLEALESAFVKIQDLALLIFDEAHHCVGNHPANRILSNFYRPLVKERDAGTTVPHVLGLSASPVMRAKANAKALEQLENNMCATVCTPKLHRAELARFSHRPELIRVDFPTYNDDMSPLLIALCAEVRSYDLDTDPYMVHLYQQQREGHDVERQLQKIHQTMSTYCCQQLKGLVTKAHATTLELGQSASDWYILQCIAEFQAACQSPDSQLVDWSLNEKQHLMTILRRVASAQEPEGFSILDSLSHKAKLLIDILSTGCDTSTTGLVFVEQRIWVAILEKILANHPSTKGRFNLGTFVGASQSSKRKPNVANFLEPRNKQDTLEEFRAGGINVIITTSALEEGIDVSSCHLVICFECPKNLKSFVQRRGRARKQDSKYYLFTPETSVMQSSASWEGLEEEMRKAYMDDLRRAADAQSKEAVIEQGERFYRVPTTGALLTFENVNQRLHHFCSLLSSSAFVDTRPQYDYTTVDSSLIIAQVTLPLSVDATIRTARSSRGWNTERMARKDANFEMYKILHIAGLVNDNLLPSREHDDLEAHLLDIPTDTPSLVDIAMSWDPWSKQEAHEGKSFTYHRTLVQLRKGPNAPMQFLLLHTNCLPDISHLILYWNEHQCLEIDSSALPIVSVSDEEKSLAQSITHRILASIHSGRMQASKDDFALLVLPSDEHNPVWTQPELEAWYGRTAGFTPAFERMQHAEEPKSDWGTLTVEDQSHKYFPQEVLPSPSGFVVRGVRVPKRRDFLHQIPKDATRNEAYSRIEDMEAENCLVANLPAEYTVLALVLPCIIHQLESLMVADQLRTTLLAPLSLPSSRLPLLLQSLTSSATGEAANYQRLEFLGDCILKSLASIHVMAAHTLWPESLLTEKKGRIVSNGYLARAALSAGLDQFILTKRFTGAKWSPRYDSDNSSGSAANNVRKASSKLLADVVEALIGATYSIGGFELAFQCLQILLPSEPWTPVSTAYTTLDRYSSDDMTIINTSAVETIIGHEFRINAVLLEALTHASYNGPFARRSYERLEFLGDAVLDYIVSTRLYTHEPALSHQKMHAIRTAMVNGTFLAFRMFETTELEDTVVPATKETQQQKKGLWHYLRASDLNLLKSRVVAAQEHAAHREQILHALEHDTQYPWHLLSLTDPPKFLSDIVESVFAAILIDSQGKFADCEKFAHRLGILPCLDRILRDDVDCLHPKERLGHLAVDKDVRYDRVPTSVGDAQSTSTRVHKVQVLVGEEKIGDVQHGLKRLNAETIAAHEAVKILVARNGSDAT